LDESQNITIFSNKNGKENKQQFKVEKSGSIPADIAKKDLFGMGYPYFINLYDKYIAASSDYGVLFFEIS
jgi:hypothetical protein